MPYRKRRTYRKKRMYRRKGKSGYIKKIVAKAINKNVEMKMRIYQYNSVGVGITGSGVGDFSSISYGSASIAAGLCAGIANGTGEGQRIGNSIKLKGFQINWALQPGDNTNYVRILLLAPKKQVDLSSVANFTQQALSNQGSSGTQWLQPVDTDVHKVLMDKRIWFQFRPVDGSTATSVAQARFVKKFIKFNKKIVWQLSAPTVPLREIYLLALSDSAAVANPGAVAGFVKIWYQDG